MRRLPAHLHESAFIERLEDRRLLTASVAPAFVGQLPAALPAVGDTRITVRLTDTGTAKANESAVIRVFASTDSALDSSDLLLATMVKNIHLGPKDSTNVVVDVPSPTTLPDGPYELLAQVDGTSVVAVSSKPVVYQNPFSDVAVEFVSVPSRPVEIDGPAAGCRSATVDVVETGNTSIRGKVNLSFYLSSDAVLDSSDALLATVTDKTIVEKSGGKTPVSFRVTVPPGTTVGGYFLFAVVTPGSGIVDSNSVNNTAISSRRVSVVTQLPHQWQNSNNDDSYIAGGGSCIADPGCDVDTGSYDGYSDDGDDTSYSSGDTSQDSTPSNDAGISSSTDDSSGSDDSDSGDYISTGGDF
jgi:hypothetical protein